MHRFKKWAAAALAGVALLAFSPAAPAAFQIRLQSGVQVITIDDNSDSKTGASDGGKGDLDDTAGSIQINRTLGTGLLINAKITGTNNQIDPFTGLPYNPPPTEARLAMTAITITNTSGLAQTLKVDLSTTGYTFPTGGALALSSSVSATASAFNLLGGDAITFQSYADSGNGGNNLYGGTLLNPSGGAVTTGAQTSASVKVNPDKTLDIGFIPGTNRVPGPNGLPFSMTQEVTFVLAAGASLTLNGQSVVATPAPAGLLLALSGLPLLGLGRWLRRRKQGGTEA